MIRRTLLLLSAVICGTAMSAPAGDAGSEWDPPRRLTRQPALSKTSINFARSIATDHRGRVHVAWVDERDGNPEVYVKRSVDGGASWGPARRLTNDPEDSNNPSIAAAGDAVHVVWWDTRSGVHQIYHRGSPDGGLSWGPVRQLTDSPGGGAHCAVAAVRSRVHVVYVDGRDGQSEVYALRSVDSGATWESPVRLSATPFNSYTPTIAASGGHVYVAWTDTRHGTAVNAYEEEYFRASHDCGVSWLPELRLTDDPENSWAPSLVASGRSVWIVWFDERTGNWELYTKRSTDGGATWTADRRLTFDEGASQRPVISRRGKTLFVVWWDTRDAMEEVYGIASPDLGASWGEPIRLDDSPGGSLLPSVAAAVHGIHVVWTDGRHGQAELYHRRLPLAPARVANGRIAYVRPAAGGSQIFTAAADGGDERQLTFSGGNDYPAYSRDGSRIAFSSDRGGTREIWVMEADGSDQTRLAAVASGGDFTPDWSTNGTRIAFTAMRPEVGHPEVWVMDADGSDRIKLTSTPPNPGGFTWSLHPSWSADDERIYFASTKSGSTQIWGMLASGLGLEQKTAGAALDAPHANVPEFSRNGERLVFWAGFEAQFGEIWTMNPGGGDLRRLTETPDPRNSDDPAWSPDGAEVLFATNRSPPEVEIWVMNTDGTDPRPLIRGPIWGGQVSWQAIAGPVSLARRVRGRRLTP